MGGKGGICPPWNFQNEGIPPDFPPLKVEIMTFLDFYSTLPPLDPNPYTGADICFENIANMSNSYFRLANKYRNHIIFITPKNQEFWDQCVME